jgi:hypothetical protein
LTDLFFIADLKNLTRLNLSSCTLSNEADVQVLNALSRGAYLLQVC